MPAINFTMFIDKVESGEKTQTIRKHRKRPIMIGDTLQLFTGMRTKECRRLGTGRCTGVEPIIMHGQGVQYTALNLMISKFQPEALNHFAKRDGFDSWADMAAWFHIGWNPFKGDLIQWELIK